MTTAMTERTIPDWWSEEDGCYSSIPPGDGRVPDSMIYAVEALGTDGLLYGGTVRYSPDMHPELVQAMEYGNMKALEMRMREAEVWED